MSVLILFAVTGFAAGVAYLHQRITHPQNGPWLDQKGCPECEQQHQALPKDGTVVPLPAPLERRRTA